MKSDGNSVGADFMRFIIAFGLLIILSASANAAPAHRARLRPVAAPPNQAVTAPGARFAVPGWSDEATRRWLDNASSSSRNAG
jgi:hypothetical protein